jgi:predicted transcriptional regulator
MGVRRNKLEIVSDILKSIQDKGGKIKPTHLLYKSNLSHIKMQQYIEELIGKDLLKKDFNDRDKFFLITDKGLKFLEEYKRIREFTDSFGIEF